MSVRLYPWDIATKEIGGEWANIVQSQALNPSLHPSWMRATVESHEVESRARVIVTRVKGETAVIPVLSRTIIVGGLPMRCIDMCSNIISYHAEIVASGAIQFHLEELLSSKILPRWDVFRFANIPVASETHASLDAVAKELSLPLLRYGGESSPYIPIVGEWDGFLSTLSKKMRANITRCERTTNQAGSSRMEWYQRGCDTERLLLDILDVEARSWKASENKSIQSNSREVAYYRKLLPWLAENGLLSNVLYLDDRPAAYALCVQSQGWVGQLKTSFAQDVKDSGFRVIQASIERSFANSWREYDFLGDAAPHKLRWTSQVRQHESTWVFAKHLRGSLSHVLKKSIDRMRRSRMPKPAAVDVE